MEINLLNDFWLNRSWLLDMIDWYLIFYSFFKSFAKKTFNFFNFFIAFVSGLCYNATENKYERVGTHSAECV